MSPGTRTEGGREEYGKNGNEFSNPGTRIPLKLAWISRNVASFAENVTIARRSLVRVGFLIAIRLNDGNRFRAASRTAAGSFGG